MERNWLGMGYVVVAALLWSFAGLGIKLVQATPLAIAGYRAAFALPIFCVALVLMSRKPGNSQSSLKSMAREPLVLAAGLAYTFTVVCFVLANKLTTSANAIFLQYTSPIYVALLSWPLLGERLRKVEWACVALSFVGLFFFFSGELSLSGFWGNIIALISGGAFALLAILLRKCASRGLQAQLTGLLAVTLGNALTVVVCVPAILSQGALEANALAVLVALGTIQIGVAYVCYVNGVTRLQAVHSILLVALEPMLSPVWVLLATGEKPGVSSLVGGAVIIGAVSLYGIQRARAA